MKINFKNIISYFVAIICVISIFAHEFFPKKSDILLKTEEKVYKLKDQNKKALTKVKEFAKSKSSNEYKEYILINKEFNRVKKEYNNLKENQKVLSFKDFKVFMYNFGKNFCFFSYALFMLIRSFYFDKEDIGIKIVHIAILFCTFFYFYWIFQPHPNVPQLHYIIASIISSAIVFLGLFFVFRYRKTTIQRLTTSRDEAVNTIENLEKEVLIKQEEQRAKVRQQISEELHDGVLGKLFGTRIGLGFLQQPNDNTNKEKYQRLLAELQEIEKEIRDVSHKLSSSLDGSDINFYAIVEQLLKDKSKIGRFNYSVKFDNSISWNEISEIDRVNLYRILQETIQNIIKHAAATKVLVDFKRKENQRIDLVIEDNGNGFNTSEKKNGIGLKNISSRVKKLKGILVVESKIGVGTKIHINFPYSTIREVA